MGDYRENAADIFILRWCGPQPGMKDYFFENNRGWRFHPAMVCHP